MKFLILLSCVAAAFASQLCGENQHHEDCGTACPLTCRNHLNPPKFCVLSCNVGCHCDKGYVKADDGRCVRPEECPSQAQEVCGENEVYKKCGTACPLTCDNYQDAPIACIKICKIGCECAKGFVRADDGKCVRPSQCRASEVQTCLGEAEPGMCRGAFPMWYYNAKTQKCHEFIYGGCGGNGNRYATKEECMGKCSECAVNEHYDSCGTHCPKTCDNMNDSPKACILSCNAGCTCNEGYVRNATGHCIAPENCESDDWSDMCDVNQHYEACGTSCPLTCDNYYKPPRTRDCSCTTVCRCDKGYVRHPLGPCVRPSACPDPEIVM